MILSKSSGMPLGLPQGLLKMMGAAGKLDSGSVISWVIHDEALGGEF
jgi:hypothetical protein